MSVNGTPPQHLLSLFNAGQKRRVAILSCLVSGILGTSGAVGQSLHLGDDLVGSARMRGLGGAGIHGDDGYTAAAINPAFIGVGKGKSDSIFAIKQLTFPYFQLSADQNSFTDNQNIAVTRPDQLKLEKLASGPLQKGYVDATLMPSFVIGRTFIGFVMHHEAILGAKANFDPSQRSDPALALRYRQHSGPMIGFAHGSSALQLGVSGAYLSQSVLDGDFSYDQLDTPKARKAAFGPLTREYTGIYSLAGLTYTFYSPWALSLAAVAHNPGGSTFVGEGGSYVMLPRYQAALALRPVINPWLTIAASLQLEHRSGPVLAERLAAGVEWLLGKERHGKKDFAIRLGYNKVGLGYGLKANLGLVAIEFAEDAKSFVTSDSGPALPGALPATGGTADWAADDSAFRRRSVSLTINVADF